ncbi:hypothetical protein SAMN05421544_11513 [Riemerella columbipharyngis]|uniref:Uncharacterized protein n=1 Tax=Riemerella columbipharyngis TaxID=1071918 RepID=A0A1G7EBR8_9FLAO|nr:hypothetical protein SAMN05421544_11513 [Riemerella columbipharyngis]
MKRSRYCYIVNLGLNICFILVFLSSILHFFNKGLTWSYPEFFISYKYTFIRRGLVGSILLIFSNLFARGG